MIDYKLVYQKTWDDGILCERCPYRKEITDWVPYGMGNVPHVTETCDVESISDCLGVIYKIEEEAWNNEMAIDSSTLG